MLKSEPPVEQTQNTGDPRKRQPARPTTHQALSHLPRQQPTLSTFSRPQSTLSASLPSDLNHTSPRTSILHQALVCMFFPKGLRLLLLLSRFSRVRLCATPETATHQAPPSLGFSRQEHWSGLPFPSPMHESEK